MTMQVFALLGSVTATPAGRQPQLAVTDDSEGQPQSYAEDLAALLASMEQALGQLDSAIQQEPMATPGQQPEQGLVLSMQPQPLLFDPSVPTLTPLSNSGAAAPSGPLTSQAGPTADLVLITPELSAAPATLAAEFLSSGLPAASQPSATVTLTAVTPPVPQASVAWVPALPSQTRPQAMHSAELLPGLNQAQSPTSASLSPIMAQLQNNLRGQSATVAQPIPLIDQSGIVSTLPTVAASAPSALPVWQADPLPAQSPQWGQRLIQMLADKVDLQLGLHVNKAMIRLDPPSLGSIELSVQLDGDRLTVQMHSSNTQLREAMGQGLEQLRASLQQKLGADVQIELRMGSDSSSQQQQQNMAQQRPPQPDANFHSEPEGTAAETRQPNTLNLVNQLV